MYIYYMLLPRYDLMFSQGSWYSYIATNVEQPNVLSGEGGGGWRPGMFPPPQLNYYCPILFRSESESLSSIAMPGVGVGVN